MKKVIKRNFVNLNINPCKQCMPMGATMAFKGIAGCVMLLHGSQGCSTYIRRHMSAHYNEPMDIASSSLSEQGTVYGGASNMKKAIKNMVKQYNPEIIGVATTCLAETIGENIERIIEEFKSEEADFVSVVNLKTLIPVATPGYGGSQFEGYYFTLKKLVEKLTIEGGKSGKINIVAPSVTPADIRELKKIIESFGVEYTMLPDISETLDAPYSTKYKKIAEGGTTLEEIASMGKAVATIEFGYIPDDRYSPGVYLKEKFGIELYRLPLPIGLAYTDQFINTLEKITGKEMSSHLKTSRGRMIDGIIDSHKHNAEGRAAIFGDPEVVIAVAKLCFENGILPAVISTGSSASKITEMFKEELAGVDEECIIIDDTDFQTIREYAKQKNVNILIGNSSGKFIAEKDGLPLVRIGFPIHDRVGAQRALNIGYEGSMRFLDSITNTLIEEKYSTFRQRMYDEYYKESN